MKRTRMKNENGALTSDQTNQIKPNKTKSRLIKVVFLKMRLGNQPEGRAVTSAATESGDRQFWIGLTDLKMKAAMSGAGAFRCL